jgi:hypothetical protein
VNLKIYNELCETVKRESTNFYATSGLHDDNFEITKSSINLQRLFASFSIFLVSTLISILAIKSLALAVFAKKVAFFRIFNTGDNVFLFTWIFNSNCNRGVQSMASINSIFDCLFYDVFLYYIKDHIFSTVSDT